VYNFSNYAADPLHTKKIRNILKKVPIFKDSDDIQKYIKKKAPKSPITGEMIAKASQRHKVSDRLLVALMRQESQLGTRGVAVKTKNPGNVGNTGTECLYNKSWEKGVDLCAEWIATH